MPRELKAHRLEREIDELIAELRAHQAKCKHVRATFSYGAPDGINGDPHSGTYWNNWKCPTCLKRWREYLDR